MYSLNVNFFPRIYVIYNKVKLKNSGMPTKKEKSD